MTEILCFETLNHKIFLLIQEGMQNLLILDWPNKSEEKPIHIAEV